MKNNLKSRDRDLVVQELEHETLIYDLTINKAYCLNETAAFVWKSLDGETDVRQIAGQLAVKTKCAVNEEIVWLTIDELKKDNLIANAGELPSRFEGMNRREVVKRIGLATMIALPIVSSLTAPTSAMAASACGTTTPVASGCPVGNGLGYGGNCTAADQAGRDSRCDEQYGATGSNGPNCIGNAVSNGCTPFQPGTVFISCQCA